MRFSLPCFSQQAGKGKDHAVPSSEESEPVPAKPVATANTRLTENNSTRTGRTTQDHQQKSVKRTTSTNATPDENCTGNSVRKPSVLWERAVERVKETEDWKNYCKIIRKEHLSPSKAVSIHESQADSTDSPEDSAEEMISSSPDDVLGIVIARLQTAKEVRDMCWEVLPRATYLISRYGTMEELYASKHDVCKSRSMLEQALIELYEHLLEYQMAMIFHLNDRIVRFKASFSDTSSSRLSKVWAEIKDKEATLSDIQSLADREINNESFDQLIKASEKLNDSLDKTWDEVQGISRIVNSQQRRDILNWISELKYEDAHNSKRRTAAVDYATGNWLLEHHQYREWRGAVDPSIFWLHGFMGSGKSCLTHLAIEDMKENIERRYGQQLAYYYIDGAEDRGDQDLTRKILCCLLKQLADPGSKTKVTGPVLNIHETRAEKGSLTEDQTMILIQKVLSGNYSTYLVLDGLDECDRNTFNQLMNRIGQLCDGARGRVQVFFSSRQEPFIEHRMRAFDPRKINVAANNVEDIQKYISTRLQHSIRDWPELYRRGDEDQSRDVRDTLQNNAQGMFRWIDVAFDHLHGGQNFSDMQERLKELNHLPKLFDLYDKIYVTAMETLGRRSRDALRLSLTMMLYGGFPGFHHGRQIRSRSLGLRRNTWMKGIADGAVYKRIAGVAYMQESSSLRLEPKEVLALCPSFIQFSPTSEDKSDFQFPHFSVKEYLLERRGDEYQPRIGHCHLAKESLKIFVEGNCYKRAQDAANGLFMTYASWGWVTHLRRARAAGSDISWEVLIKDGGLAEDINAFLLQSPLPEAFLRWQGCAQNYVALDNHDLLPLAQPPSTLFAHLMFDLPNKDMDFSLAHLEAEWIGAYPGSSAIHLASQLHNTVAIEWLASKKVNMNKRFSANATVFLSALLGSERGSDVETIKTLLNCKAKPHVPRGCGPYARYAPMHQTKIASYIPGPDTYSDLEEALRQKCSMDAAIVLFVDGYSKVEAPREWYILALWASVKERHVQLRHELLEGVLYRGSPILRADYLEEGYTKSVKDFNQWLLQRYDDYVPRNFNICDRRGLPASRYITEDSWASSPLALRKRFIAQGAACVGKKFEDSEEQWQLDPEPDIASDNLDSFLFKAPPYL
ncbi:MAG: hypothetical protein Q9165_008290 [Trypethelium subeluteriae]